MDKLRSKARLHLGGAVLENPIPMHAIFGWAGDDDDEPRVPKCKYDVL